MRISTFLMICLVPATIVILTLDIWLRENPSLICFADYGAFTDHRYDIPSDTTRVSGDITFWRGNYGPRWQALSEVMFVDDAKANVGDDCGCAGIRVYAYQEDPDWLHVYLRHDGINDSLGKVPARNPVTYQMTYDVSGQLKLEVGTGVVTAQLNDFHIQHLLTNCSSATVSFWNTKISS
jgi:hypothetical protein